MNGMIAQLAYAFVAGFCVGVAFVAFVRADWRRPKGLRGYPPGPIPPAPERL